MSNNVTPEAVVSAAAFSFTTVDLDTFTSLPVTGQLSAACLYVGANSSTEPTGVTDAHPFPVTCRNASGTVLGDATTPWKVDGSAVTQPVSAASLPLPSGAATSAAQTTGNSSLSSIDGKITACNTGAVVLTTGSATIGKLAANAGVTIGAVEIASAQTLGTVTTVATVTNLAQMAGAAIAMGTGVRSAGTQRVTIATDDIVPVSQNGTWTVGLSAAQTLATVTTVSTVTTLTTLTGGGVAHDAADSGNPVKVGAKAVSSLASVTLVAAADRTDNVSDLDGALIVRSEAPLGDTISERVSDTSGTSTAFTNFSAVASTRNYIRGYSVYNASATAGYIDFRDGAAGAILWTVPLPAGGGANVICDHPIFRTSANTALAYDVSAALTTVYISVTGFQSKA